MVLWCGIGVCESLPQVLKAGIYWSLLITRFLFSDFSPFFFFFLLLLPLTKALGLGKKTAVRERLVSVISLLCASSNFETSLSKQNSCGLQCDGRVHQGCSRRGGWGGASRKICRSLERSAHGCTIHEGIPKGSQVLFLVEVSPLVSLS